MVRTKDNGNNRKQISDILEEESVSVPSNHLDDIAASLTSIAYLDSIDRTGHISAARVARSNYFPCSRKSFREGTVTIYVIDNTTEEQSIKVN